MAQPQQNDTVSLAVVGKLDNGQIFFTAENDKPFQIKVGNSDLPPTVESAILEMNVGESKQVRVPPEEGFGPRQKDLLQEIDNQDMVDRVKPKPGMILSLKVDKDGSEEKVPATVITVEGSVVTVDYNHPLAGHHLTYDITLLGIG